MATNGSANLEAFHEHWQDEGDAAFLYAALAAVEKDPAKRDVYARLSEVEVRHTEIWAKLLREEGKDPGPSRPSIRARIMAGLGKRLGPSVLLPALLREEGREVKGYLDLYRVIPRGDTGSSESLLLAKESAEHATHLAELSGKDAGREPWHSTESGGYLRNIVYGFNDGLTANFGLVAGVLGAATSAQHRIVIVAGVAGLVADALSMGSSGYLAAKSELEVHEHEIATERDEIMIMPEVERDELALIYEAKGMERQAAHALATEVMRDPERMLEEKVQNELGIADRHASPFREGWITGLATAVGALIPVFPFFFLTGMAAIVTSFAVSMMSHFLVGAARSIFTGRSIFRSGFDMFVVGLGVAVAGYYVGEWLSRLLA